MQKLHHFCNTSSPDDSPRSDGKYLGNNKLWKVYHLIPAESIRQPERINKKIWDKKFL